MLKDAKKLGFLDYFQYICITEKHSVIDYKLNMVLQTWKRKSNLEKSLLVSW